MTPSFVRKSEPFASSSVTAPSFEPSIATRWSTWISLKPASLVPQPPPPAAAARRNTTGRTRSVLMRCASRLRQPQDGDRRARLVPAVQIEEERGDRLQVACVGDAPRVHGAEPGQEPDQRRDLGAGAGVVAAQDDVALERHGEILERLRRVVLERAHDSGGGYRLLDQLARRGCAVDGRQLEEAVAHRERDDDVDHELPGQRRAPRGEEAREAREREGQDEALRASHRLGVLVAAHRSPGYRGADGLRRRGGSLRHPRADHDRRARGGEAEREAEPLAPRPADERDGFDRHPSLTLTAAEHTGRRPPMECARPGMEETRRRADLRRALEARAGDLAGGGAKFPLTPPGTATRLRC